MWLQGGREETYAGGCDDDAASGNKYPWDAKDLKEAACNTSNDNPSNRLNISKIVPQGSC